MLKGCQAENIEIIITKNVRLIFKLYLRGFSIIGIKRELEKRGIKIPTGKEKWDKTKRQME